MRKFPGDAIRLGDASGRDGLPRSTRAGQAVDVGDGRRRLSSFHY